MVPRRLLCSLAAIAFLPLTASTPDSIRGFPADAAAVERKWEEQARAIPEAKRVGRYLEHMSLKPHLAGTSGSRAVAEYALSLMKEWGLDAHIEEYEALLPLPKSRVLEMVAPRAFRAKLAEPPVSADATSSDPDEVPSYNAYSGSGDVTAALVYANHGMPADYEYLAKNGIDVKGKIVLTRYGGGWRGLKPRLAAEHGAVGCLIYSDPHDDGFFRGDVYPKGPWRPADGVQRGSVVDMTLYPGDPLSPGWASEKGSKRLALSEAKTLMTIPVLPISYGDALPLLESLEGPVAPEAWRGALGITYHIGNGVGNGAERVRLKVEMDNSIHPLYDVVAKIPGSDFPDEWLLAGNHHDAWVHGALDPLSGASALLETARTLAELQKQGWRPKRTILIALWDGEEFGLVGSTEFAEKHAEELGHKLVAYINSDSNSKGQLGAGGSQTLEAFVAELAHDVKDPVSGRPLADDMRVRSTGRGSGERKPVPAADWHMEALGSGSDYTSFLQHLGVASLNFGFGDETGSGGIYHSAYDSYYWYTHFGDASFVYGKTLATVTALALMRLGDSPLLPFQFIRFANSVGRYVDEIERSERPEQKVELEDVRREVKDLQKTAAAFETSYGRALPRIDHAQAADLTALNARLFGTEREMLLDTGLPRRDWFKHAIYAPGSLTGYDVKTLPGIREAVEAGNVGEAQEQASRVVQVLRSLNQQLQETTRMLNAI